MYILGMSERSAKLAGRRGLPFVIAQMGQSSKSIDEVIKVYRDEFERWHGRYGGKSDEDVSDSFVGKIGEILEPDVRGKFDADSEGRSNDGEDEESFVGHARKRSKESFDEVLYGGHEEYSRAPVHEGLRKILVVRNHM